MKVLSIHHKPISLTLSLTFYALFAFGLTACFDSNTEDAPPSQGELSGNVGGGKPFPSITNDTLSVPPDTSGVVNVLENDIPVGDGTLTITSFDSTSANNGIVTDNGDGTFTYTPEPGFEGDDTFIYTAQDSIGTFASATVVVTVSQQVIPNGQAFYAANCAICHSAGNEDTTSAFRASDLALSTNPLSRDLSTYGGEYQLMGAFYALSQTSVDELKAYLATLTP